MDAYLVNVDVEKSGFMLGKQVIPKTPEALVEGVDKLVSLPEVCFLVNDLINDPKTDIEDIGQVISQDPDLTARLLKLVNSSYYGFNQRVDTVTRAILLVGLKELQHMVWASKAVESFTDISPSDANMASFWRHSIFTAVVARILARDRNVLHPERLFVAGLLHDVGRLLIFHRLPEQAAQIISSIKERSEYEACEIEQEVLGYDHTQIAHALLTQWQLPPSLVEAIQYHHNPAAADQAILEASILHVANIMAHALEIGDEDKLEHTCMGEAWTLLELTNTRIKPILHEAVMQFLEALELLLPGASQKL
ncbi:MAG: HDOD domain-containing protein [Gammaproteobacteria bacterium]|nr:HDOD domain-containing protein [Gammaproteobacteria bacterium]MDH5730740.1 HDOD domain-containing protein [Gammaproteobacteria bacterium]